MWVNTWKLEHKALQTLTQDNVGGRDADVFKVHFKVATMDSIWAQKQEEKEKKFHLVRKALLSCLHAKTKLRLGEKQENINSQWRRNDRSMILPSCPNTVSGLTSFTPGVSIGTRSMLCWPCLRNKAITQFTLTRIWQFFFHTAGENLPSWFILFFGNKVVCVCAIRLLTKQEESVWVWLFLELFFGQHFKCL